MNKRFRQLAVQAGATVDKGTHPLTGVVDGLFIGPNEIEKFAELIVRECAQLARDTDLEDVEGGDSAVLRAATLQILEHFGVEE